MFLEEFNKNKGEKFNTFVKILLFRGEFSPMIQSYKVFEFVLSSFTHTLIMLFFNANFILDVEGLVFLKSFLELSFVILIFQVLMNN